MTPADAKRVRYRGRATVAAALHEMPEAEAEVFAGALVEGVREWAIAHLSDQAAYELLQAAADGVGAHKTAAGGAPLTRPPTEGPWPTSGL